MPQTNALTRVLNWLRAGYPAGIPQTDYLPLLEVLHRALTPYEVDSIAAELASRAASGVRIDGDEIRTMISAHAYESASPEDVHRVSAALAQAGWPLAGLAVADGPDDDEAPGADESGSGATDTGSATTGSADTGPTAVRPVSGPGAGTSADSLPASDAGIAARIVGWLREGYPAGVPDQDYVPLLALLRRRLTTEEVKAVAKALRRAEVSPAGPDDIAAAIEDLIRTTPSEEDLHRVKDRLARKGWPVDFPDPDAPARPRLVRA